MLVAKQKRKENIAEYILYLYQIEDMIRAFKLDMKLIEERLVANYKADDKTKAAITDWYANLVLMMDKEKIREKGHYQPGFGCKRFPFKAYGNLERRYVCANLQNCCGAGFGAEREKPGGQKRC